MENFDLAGLVDQLTPVVAAWGFRVFTAIALLIIGRKVAKALRSLTGRVLKSKELDPSLIGFLSTAVYYATLTFVVLAVLARFGIQTASFIAVLGAASLAVGLAMQGTFANFASGIMLLVFRPFEIDDLVDIAGTEGVVAEIGIFSTQLNTLDHKRVIVSNSAVWGQTIINYTANKHRRVDMTFGVGYGDDLGLAQATMRDIVQAHPMVLVDPAADVEVAELGDSSVNFVVRPWCRTENYWRVYFDLHRSIKEGLEAAGCSIPFPQRDVHLFQEAP